MSQFVAETETQLRIKMTLLPFTGESEAFLAFLSFPSDLEKYLVCCVAVLGYQAFSLNKENIFVCHFPH